MLTTSQAAGRLGVNASRIRQMIGEGQLPSATKIGRDWLIDEAELEAVGRQRAQQREAGAMGRPPAAPATPAPRQPARQARRRKRGGGGAG